MRTSCSTQMTSSSILRSPSDAANFIQHDIDALNVWSEENELHLSINKCHVISFYKIKSAFSFDYYINTLILDGLNIVKDLGLFFDSSLSFTHHIDHVISKSPSLIGFIKRTTVDFNNAGSIIYLYKTTLREKRVVSTEESGTGNRIISVWHAR